MMTMLEKAKEQLRRGNPVDYAGVLQQRLDESNRNLHRTFGVQEIGQIQGRAAAIQEILDDWKTAGIEPDQ